MDKVLEDRFYELAEATENVSKGDMPQFDLMSESMEATNFLIETRKIKDVQTAAAWLLRNKEMAEKSLGKYKTDRENENFIDNAAMDMLKVHFCKQHIETKFNIDPDDSNAIGEALKKRKKIFGIF